MVASKELLAQQKRLLIEAESNCSEKLSQLPYPEKGTYCERTWDGLMCWGDAMLGETLDQPCPNYIVGLDPKKTARKHCTMDGSWFVHPKTNLTWTDYTECKGQSSAFPLIEWHLPYIRLMYNIGYGLSLCTLTIAMLVMIACRVRKKSNALHLNLFAAFILRATISFIKENLLVEGIGFSYDVMRDEMNRVVVLNDSHWQCKLLFTTFHYTISLTHVWIFVEGLYLHTLVFCTLWIEKHGIKTFVIIGWVLPVVAVGAWVIMRITRENELCWNTTESAVTYWILRGPVVCTVVINFGFFVNILRVLLSRARSPHRQMAAKYRRMAKFTLALIPLFGLVYVLYLAVPHTLNERLDLLYFYSEMLINSIQGFILALLFCFLNEEVHNEIKKSWNKCRLRFSTPNIFWSTQSKSQSSYRTYKSRANNLDTTMTGCQELQPIYPDVEPQASATMPYNNVSTDHISEDKENDIRCCSSD